MVAWRLLDPRYRQSFFGLTRVFCDVRVDAGCVMFSVVFARKIQIQAATASIVSSLCAPI